MQHLLLLHAQQPNEAFSPTEPRSYGMPHDPSEDDSCGPTTLTPRTALGASPRTALGASPAPACGLLRDPPRDGA